MFNFLFLVCDPCTKKKKREDVKDQSHKNYSLKPQQLMCTHALMSSLELAVCINHRGKKRLLLTPVTKERLVQLYSFALKRRGFSFWMERPARPILRR